MKSAPYSLAIFLTLTGFAAAHPSVQDHAHPHTDAASYFTIEALVIFLAGLSIGGFLAYRRRRKEMDK